MPTIDSYDVRLPVWNWILENHEDIDSQKIRINRKPQWKWDLEKATKKEYFKNFFADIDTRKKSLKTAASMEHLGLQKTN